MTGIAPERELVVLLSRIEPRPDAVERARELLSGPVRWTEFLGQAHFQRVAALVWCNLLKHDLTGPLHREACASLRFNYQAQCRWHHAFTLCVHETIAALDGAGVEYAFLKGTVLAQNVYPSGTRTSNDSDILVPPDELSRCTAALAAAGYVQGRYDYGTAAVIPATRKEKVFARMAQYELIPFFQKLDDPFLPAHKIDVNFSLVLDPGRGSGPDVSTLLIDSIPFDAGGVMGRTLAAELFLLQLCVHFHKEASGLPWVTVGQDLGLYKLVDIVEFATRKWLCWDRFAALAAEHRLSHSAYYALYHAEQVYGKVVPDTVLRALRPDDVSYLDEYSDGTADGARFRWKMPFMDRLFDETRRVEHQGEDLGAYADYRRMVDQLAAEDRD